MTGWELSADLGATCTRTATRQDGVARPLELDGATGLPSGVARAADGTMLAGQIVAGGIDSAVMIPRLAVAAGARTRVRGATVAASELAAVVLAHLAAAARAGHGGAPPGRLVITHPVGWDAQVLGRLAEAAARAALPAPAFVIEPVAAASHYGAAGLPAGVLTGVLDLGGRSSAATILCRTENGFRLAGPPGTDHSLGAGDFDDVLSDLVSRGGEVTPPRPELTLAREALSSRPTCWITVDDAGHRVRVTRPEFQDAIAGLAARVTSLFTDTMARAGVRPADLAAVYLAGGGGRTPLVARQLGAALGDGPELVPCEAPELAVVLGALAAADRSGGGGGRPVNRDRPGSSPFEDD